MLTDMMHRNIAFQQKDIVVNLVVVSHVCFIDACIQFACQYLDMGVSVLSYSTQGSSANMIYEMNAAV